MQAYFPSIRQVPSRATILKHIRAYRRLAKAIINANVFGIDLAENLAFTVIFVIVILAVGGFIVAEVFNVIGQSMPSLSPNNILYNATIKVVYGLEGLGGMFSSSIGLLSILILIAVVSAVIVMLRSGFGRGGAGGTGS